MNALSVTIGDGLEVECRRTIISVKGCERTEFRRLVLLLHGTRAYCDGAKTGQGSCTYSRESPRTCLELNEFSHRCHQQFQDFPPTQEENPRLTVVKNPRGSMDGFW
jgi:hypothetical protein